MPAYPRRRPKPVEPTRASSWGRAFGIAKARGRLHVTEESKLKGKLAYMAPERLRGAAASPASDLFGVGVVLSESLAGRRLFGGRSEAETLRKILSGAVPPLSTLRPDAPAELDEVIRRALDPVPEARYSSAEELARALERIAPPAGPVATTPRAPSFGWPMAN